MDDMASLLTSPKEVEEASMPTENPILSDEECLKERKWWCFLLSSIFTFLMGVLSVVVVRGIISICCHKEEDEFSQAELRRQEEEAKKLRLQVCAISQLILQYFKKNLLKKMLQKNQGFLQKKMYDTNCVFTISILLR